MMVRVTQTGIRHLWLKTNDDTIILIIKSGSLSDRDRAIELNKKQAE